MVYPFIHDGHGFRVDSVFSFLSYDGHVAVAFIAFNDSDCKKLRVDPVLLLKH